MFTYENGSIVLFALVLVMITVAPFVFAAIVSLVIPEVMALMLVNVLVLSIDVAVCFGDVVTAMLRLFNDIFF